VEELLGWFTDDAVYHNIPLPPAEGKAAIEATLRQFVGPGGEADFEIRNLAVVGNVVLTERIDRLTMAGKPVVLPVMGAFDLRDGKIAAWRDYFDMATWRRQMGGG
jgi:limonene-1,2-epoxide hydrolase